MHIRLAKNKEYKIISELCRMAEGAPDGIIPFQRIFTLSDKETEELFEALARFDEESIPYSFTSYYFLEDSGKIAGGCSAWIEEDFPTEKIMLQILGEILGFEKIVSAKEKLQIASELSMRRTPGTLQLECIALLPEFRGQGLVRKLLLGVIQQFKQKNPSLKQAEIIVMENNFPAIKAYRKAGFEVTETLQGNSEELNIIYSGNTKVKLVKKL